STKFTFKHRPWELKLSFVAGNSRAEAMKIERYIKRQKSRQFIQALIEPTFPGRKIKSVNYFGDWLHAV
ncbi:MAG: hypothetical protein AAF587_28035, partial [Bacteroidota bacterium]